MAKSTDAKIYDMDNSLDRSYMNLFQGSLKISVNDWFSGTKFLLEKGNIHLDLTYDRVADGLDGVIEVEKALLFPNYWIFLEIKWQPETH